MGFDDIDRKHRPRVLGSSIDSIDRFYKPDTPAKIKCETCRDTGWLSFDLGSGGTVRTVCGICRNPADHPKPGM